MTASGLLEVCYYYQFSSDINISGHDYMAALAQAIENAEHEVLILDWWLNPELVSIPLLLKFKLNL